MHAESFEELFALGGVNIADEILSFLPRHSVLPLVLSTRCLGNAVRHTLTSKHEDLQSFEKYFVSSISLTQWAIHMGCRADRLCDLAARFGYLDVLIWLREENSPPYPWNDYICDYAARGGHVHILKWLRRDNTPPCECDERTSRWAASRGHLHVLKWLREDNSPPCPWNEYTCADAARGGHIDVLRWLRLENNPPCPWNEDTCAAAAMGGHLHVLKWLREGIDPPCPWDAHICVYFASKHSHRRIVSTIAIL